MAAPDVEGAISYALSRLERELSPAHSYHSLAHTRDDVAPAAARLAALSDVHGPQLQLLRTAAYFHDLGFVVQHHEHEAAGAAIAAAVLARFGYDPCQIHSVTGMILATRLPQRPAGPLEELLADADLDLLGREDFFLRNDDLRREQAAFGAPASDLAWYEEQLRFLAAHRYWSPAARALRDDGKARNFQALARRLAEARALAR